MESDKIWVHRPESAFGGKQQTAVFICMTVLFILMAGGIFLLKALFHAG